MADPGVVAMKQEKALRRIIDAVAQLATSLELDTPAIPTFGRDLSYLHMEQMEALAATLEAIHTRINPPGIEAETETVTDSADGDTMQVRTEDGAYVQDLPDYDSLSKAELFRLGAAAGLTLDPRLNKTELISRLVEADADGSDALNG